MKTAMESRVWAHAVSLYLWSFQSSGPEESGGTRRGRRSSDWASSHETGQLTDASMWQTLFHSPIPAVPHTKELNISALENTDALSDWLSVRVASVMQTGSVLRQMTLQMMKRGIIQITRVSFKCSSTERVLTHGTLVWPVAALQQVKTPCGESQRP